MKKNTPPKDATLSATLKHLSAAQGLMLEYGIGSLGQVLFKELDAMIATVERHKSDLSADKVLSV